MNERSRLRSALLGAALLAFSVLAVLTAGSAAGCGSTDDGATPPVTSDGGPKDGATVEPLDGALPSCTGAECADATSPRRPYAMGFTPFPFDATEDASAKTFDYLAEDADLYAFHKTGGVPWKAAAENRPLAEWGASIRGTFTLQKANARSGHAIYLALTPLDDSRSRLADHWAEDEHMPLDAPWNAYAFDAPEVKQAYLRFCEATIAHYAPDHLAIGIEVNLLAKTSPARWPSYVALHRETYQALKAAHPTLPIFVTLTAVDILDGWTNMDAGGQTSALADLLPYSDYLALSFYPYMSRYLTNPIPDDTFDRLSALAGGKPIAIAESGYPAESFSLVSVPASFQGTPAKQDAWFARLLTEAENRRFPFLVNFIARDYDALWEKLPPADRELGLVWRDTGFRDGTGNERPVLARWRAALARPR